ncbi:MAG: HEAT repeat domain-containing protein [Alphaproteobacteria bacterium]|nr:HEAT repeat domain-containing protein [Alphaproteobacteria bacterium]
MPFAEPGVKPHYAPDRRVRIEHLSLTLSLFPAEQRFEGSARIRVTPLATYGGIASFDLEEVEVLSVSDAEGNGLPFVHESGEVSVTVASPSVIVITWRGHDPSCGLYFTGPKPSAPDRQLMAWTQCQDEDGHYVFPCHDHPGIKHPWSIRLEGPAGFTLLSNGAEVARGEEGGRAWATFEQKEPMPAYLFTAVAAELSVLEAKWRGRPVRYYVPPGSEDDIVRAFGKTPLMIEEFSVRTGFDYPWPRYDQVVVHDFIFGGMENVACTTMTDVLLVDELGVLEWDPDSLVAHELAHQWFGDLVTCQDWSQGWLNESWATFMESVWWDADRDADEAIWYRFQTMADYLDEYASRYRRPIVSYDFREPIDLFDRHLYQKGSCVLWTLRGILGEGPFWAGVKAYLESRAHDTVHSRDFQRAMELTTGQNLDGFFHQWIHSPAHPELEIRLSESDGLLVCNVRQTQSGEGVPEAYAFPLRLEVITATGNTAITLPVKERERAWAIPVSGKVQTVRIDPGLNVLATHSWKGPRAWLERLLSDADPVVVCRAAKGLLEDGSAPAVQAVRDAMARHPFWGIRADLVGRVARHGTSIDRDAVIDVLQTDNDPRVRRAAASALASFRDTATADALLGVIEEDLSTWQLLGAALKSLGVTRDPRAIEAITPFLSMDSWAQTVATRALSGLASTRDEAVLDVLLEHTSVEHDDRLRAAAATALGELGDHCEKARTPALERLVEMLREPGFRSQIAAIGALATLGDSRAVGPLSQVHRSAPDGRTRRTAYESLVRIRRGRTTEEGLEGLRRELEALRSVNAELRERLDKLEKLDEARRPGAPEIAF